MAGQQGRVVEESGTVMLGSFPVHRLGFGTMQLTGPGVWGPPADRGKALRVLRRAVDLGVDLIDTADSYGPDVAEGLIQAALDPWPAEVRVATKAGMARTGPDQWVPLGRPEYLRQQCEMSLRRLDVERIDLFQLHRVDPQVPAAEQYGLLGELRAEGKVAEIGLSEVTAEDIEEARNAVPVVSVQNLFNLGRRNGEDVLAHCEAHGIAFIPWFPLASGRLAAPGGPLDDVAKATGASTSQVALAWLLRRSPMMVPIPGTSSLAHLEENCAAASVELSDEQFEELNDARKTLRRWALT